MIHRIDRVNPDVDDRVIKPNEARFAENLRFGASTEDTNLSGGTLILGNTLLPFTPPTGTNRVVGVYNDFAGNYVYFASYNSGTDFDSHGIYRINLDTDEVQLIVGYPAPLNFQNTDDYNVSMTVANGILFWTDNVNEPRCINIEKGIRTFAGEDEDVYKQPFLAVNYSQIKRPPAFPVLCYRLYNATPYGSTTPPDWYIINNNYTPEQASTDYTVDEWKYQITGFGNANGYQFSYYYVYDNNEESRLAPWSEPVFWKNDIVIQVPGSELSEYIQPLTIIKKVVFVYRINNDGVPYIIRSVDNISSNYVQPTQIPNYTPQIGSYPSNPAGLAPEYFITGSSGRLSAVLSNEPSILIAMPQLTALAKTALDSAITSARFDAVPLRSKANTIVSNRLVHGNYTIDYPQWTGLTLNVQVEQPESIFLGEETIQQIQEANTRLFRPGSRYSFGIELLDEYGRPITVIAETSINIPRARVGFTNIYQNIVNNIGIPPVYYYDDYTLNRYVVKYTITGNFPDWARYYRVVNTGAQDVNYFMKSIANIFYWYQSGKGEDRWVNNSRYSYIAGQSFSIQEPPDSVYEGNTIFKYKGYMIENLGVPINFSDSENLYLRIGQEYGTSNSTSIAEMYDYKISGQYGAFFAIETASKNLTPSIDVGPDGLLYYTIEVFSKKNSLDTVYYQTNQINTILSDGEPIIGYAKGDCKYVAAKKNLMVTKSDVSIYYFNQLKWYLESKIYLFPAWSGVQMGFIGMNPTNIYNSNWTWDKGQENIVDENQKQKLLTTSITFSDPIVSQTDINGLNKFNSADFRSTPTENGPISSLIGTNATQREPGVMLAIGENGVSSFYYDAVQLTNMDGSSNVTTTNAFLASQRPLLGQFGTSRPMSVTKTPLSTVYWWSDVVNDLIRYSNAGLERLGLTYSFSNYLRKTYAGNPLITTWYDQVTDEINLVGKGIVTSTFSERYKTFQGARSYVSNGLSPERSVGAATKFYNFLQGSAWVTNVDGEVGDSLIFDEYKAPSLFIVTNEQPSVAKMWNQLKVFGPHPTTTQLFAIANSTDGDGNLLSNIDYNWWIQRKGVWEAAIRRSVTSEGGVLAGKIMESRILYSIFAFDPQSFDKINFVEVRSNSSIVQ